MLRSIGNEQSWESVESALTHAHTANTVECTSRWTLYLARVCMGNATFYDNRVDTCVFIEIDYSTIPFCGYLLVPGIYG